MQHIDTEASEINKYQTFARTVRKGGGGANPSEVLGEIAETEGRERHGGVGDGTGSDRRFGRVSLVGSFLMWILKEEQKPVLKGPALRRLL